VKVVIGHFVIDHFVSRHCVRRPPSAIHRPPSLVIYLFVKYLPLLFVLSFFTPKRLCATHIVGGEITYRCLGDSTYQVTLTVYRDCYTGIPWFDDIGYIGVYSADWVLVDSLKPQHIKGLTKVDTLDILLSDPCLVVPPNVCVNWSAYRATIKLPFRPGGYTLVYQRCCRNQLIRNLLKDPEIVGASYTAYLSEFTLQHCNNSPLFRSWPPPAICIHQPIDYDHGADDVDGDSLVYRLCDPLDGASVPAPMPQPPNPGPYIEVDWQTPPYSLANLLGGEPLMIDPKTGFMTGVPNTIGNFVVGVCLDEYRDDSLINTARRDFQFNVADCGVVTSAFFTPQIVCDTLRVGFANESVGANSFQWFFDWKNDKAKTSMLKNPAFTYPDTGRYTVALVAKLDAKCTDTSYLEIHLTNGATLTATATPGFIQPGQSAQLEAVYSGPGPLTWSPAATLSDPTILNPVATPSLTTVYTVTAPDTTGDCPLVGRVRVVVQPPICAEPYIFFPTGFSPNGDGENEVLKLEGNFIEEAYWTIYNRWGERVFEANSADEVWDGTFGGRPQPAETYGYYLRVRCVGGEVAVKKGNVTLLR